MKKVLSNAVNGVKTNCICIVVGLKNTSRVCFVLRSIFRTFQMVWQYGSIVVVVQLYCWSGVYYCILVLFNVSTVRLTTNFQSLFEVTFHVFFNFGLVVMISTLWHLGSSDVVFKIRTYCICGCVLCTHPAQIYVNSIHTVQIQPFSLCKATVGIMQTLLRYRPMCKLNVQNRGRSQQNYEQMTTACMRD